MPWSLIFTLALLFFDATLASLVSVHRIPIGSNQRSCSSAAAGLKVDNSYMLACPASSVKPKTPKELMPTTVVEVPRLLECLSLYPPEECQVADEFGASMGHQVQLNFFEAPNTLLEGQTRVEVRAQPTASANATAAVAMAGAECLADSRDLDLVMDLHYHGLCAGYIHAAENVVMAPTDVMALGTLFNVYSPHTEVILDSVTVSGGILTGLGGEQFTGSAKALQAKLMDVQYTYPTNLAQKLVVEFSMTVLVGGQELVRTVSVTIQPPVVVEPSSPSPSPATVKSTVNSPLYVFTIEGTLATFNASGFKESIAQVVAVDPSNVQITNVVEKESSSRRKKHTLATVLDVSFYIANVPADTLTSLNTTLITAATTNKIPGFVVRSIAVLANPANNSPSPSPLIVGVEEEGVGAGIIAAIVVPIVVVILIVGGIVAYCVFKGKHQKLTDRPGSSTSTIRSETTQVSVKTTDSNFGLLDRHKSSSKVIPRIPMLGMEGDAELGQGSGNGNGNGNSNGNGNGNGNGSPSNSNPLGGGSSSPKSGRPQSASAWGQSKV